MSFFREIRKAFGAVAAAFGLRKPDMPSAPPPVPTAPTDDTEAKQARLDAANAAVAERAGAGRRSTMAAGFLAADDQYGIGTSDFLTKKRKMYGAASEALQG